MDAIRMRPDFSAKRMALLSRVVAASMLVSACGGGNAEKAASQTAAKVNKEEITVHQINFALQRVPNLRPEQAEAASRQVLERLIDQELAVQKAKDLKLERDPRILQQIEAARREIMARAYAERISESVAKPTAAEVGEYYSTKPALFKERRIFGLQELVIEANPEQAAAVRARLESVKNAAEFMEYLRSSGLRFNGSQAVRAAEQLPLNSVDAISRMKDGDSTVLQTPNGLTVLFLVNSRSQPLDEAAARPAIETFLTNQRKAELIAKDMKALRETAKIEYVGKFAAAAPEATATPTAQPAAPTPAASALDAATITKGLGIK